MLDTSRETIVRLALLWALANLAGRAGAAEISMAGLLDDMTNLSAMAEFPNPPYVARQFSSYDRASTTPADPKTWFANNDCGNYLRIEGERMRIVKSTGTPGPQEWDGDSGERHLWWHGGQKPGDELLLEFDVPKAGVYEVSGRFLKAIDYGIIQLAINGTNAGKPIDFYHDDVTHTAEISLGTFELQKGPNRLSAVVVGANPKAKKEYMFGLDYLIVKPKP